MQETLKSVGKDMRTKEVVENDVEEHVRHLCASTIVAGQTDRMIR